MNAAGSWVEALSWQASQAPAWPKEGTALHRRGQVSGRATRGTRRQPRCVREGEDGKQRSRRGDDGDDARGGGGARRSHDHTTYLALATLATAASMLAVVVQRAGRGSVIVRVCVCVRVEARKEGRGAGSMRKDHEDREAGARFCWSKQAQPKQAALRQGSTVG